MSRFTSYEFDRIKVAECYLPALINNDASGLSDDEYLTLLRLYEDINHQIDMRHPDEKVKFDIRLMTEDPSFGVCDASLLYAMCREVSVYAMCHEVSVVFNVETPTT
jgi:hypothetical protein